MEYKKATHVGPQKGTCAVAHVEPLKSGHCVASISPTQVPFQSLEKQDPDFGKLPFYFPSGAAISVCYQLMARSASIRCIGPDRRMCSSVCSAHGMLGTLSQGRAVPAASRLLTCLD